ncbi:glucose sorbosone dehydrogenase [Thalassobaculum fulvum]|uniref:Glucose sorbosone dehydrogenase n=1 Tax=Thalassobaculum fulvum TaxID=1633335 RepID=A0A918XUF4_9PROT|nr:PQQ-dependent sugar dehydrogenase [Thalassobaculum fulvum]GHD57142.1 glucose sorbosone dehydrogenase [Thalassobaculum fulvum]
MRLTVALMALAAGGALLTASPGVGAATRAQAKACELVAEARATGLEHPWGLAFLPYGRALVTERPGRLRLVDPSTGWSTVVEGTPDVVARGQGGLLDVALHPGFAENRLVYLSYSAGYGGGAGTGVARGRLVLDATPPRLERLETIFRINRPSGTTRHFGSRLVFDPDGYLFVTVGDRGEAERAQDPADHAGSVLRLRDDGSAPADNPFAGGGGAPEAWSTGHRNPQGMAWDRERDRLWAVEHGARGGDEINLPQRGRNYGWPTISYGVHYSGLPIGEGTAAPGLEQPVYYWDPSIAPSGLAVVTGDLFPAWRGDLLVGALKDQMLVHLTVEGDRVVGEERLFRRSFGRVRDVRMGPDGAIWLLTDEPDGKLIRIAPAAGTCG